GLSDGRLTFDDSLERNLDKADASAEAIKDTIDAHIARNAISAPVEERYTPVWRPGAPVRELDVDAARITSVVWSIGFRPDYGWIQAPILDDRGFPRHHRGVTDVPGLYVVGLPWLYTWGSGRFCGVARDAEYL